MNIIYTIMSNKPTLVKKSQGLYSQLREIRESDQGIITYHFEEKTSYNEHNGDPESKPTIIEEVGKKWTIQQPINKAVFFNQKGKFETLENVINLFKDTASDLGAKYFTI